MRHLKNERADSNGSIIPGNLPRMGQPLANHWKFVIPRQPDQAVRYSAGAYANFISDGVDVAIRYAIAQPSTNPSLVYEKLLGDEMVPVCSPKLLERLGTSNLAKIPLLHDDQLKDQPDVPTWADWFGCAGIDGGDASRGFRFSSSDHALDAAIEGAGMLLTHRILALDELRNGRLVLSADSSIPSAYSYFLVYPKSLQADKSVLAFREWLLSEIKNANL